jgi:hypothetical protein
MSEWMEAKVASLRANFREFAAACLFVRDHTTKRILPFNLNRPQRILDAVVEKQRSEIGYVRIILDKARRFGGSTYIEGRGYWKTSLNFNVNAFIVAHEEDSTDTLFSMARLFHEQNPLKPKTKYSSKKELLFDTKEGTGLKSEYSLASAKTTSAGRSQGVHFLHGSEVAFWDGNPDDLLDGLMSCISDPKDTEVYLESTGNGFGNRFQRDVFDAYQEGRHPYYSEDGITYAWKNPKTDWVLVFIPWFAHEIYTRPFDTDEQRREFWLQINRPVTDRETMRQVESEALRLIKLYGLTLEQLHWREWMISNTFKDRVENFQQEFPATVEESFLTQGANLYGKALCDLLEAACIDPILVGDPVDRQGKTKIRPNPYGHFKLWEKPDPKMSYVLTVDAGGGVKKSQEEANREPDPTCIDVWNHRTGTQAAQWHGHIHYGMIGEVTELIGNLYHRAPACVELNNHGYTVVDDLTKRAYPQFEMKPGEPGWITTKKSRPKMLDALHELGGAGALQIRCKETVSEMRTFVEINMKYQAESGCHDERVITAAMASEMMTLLARRMSPQEQKDFRGRVGAQIGEYDPGLDKKLPPSKIRPPDISLGGWMDRNRSTEPDGSLEVRIG